MRTIMVFLAAAGLSLACQGAQAQTEAAPGADAPKSETRMPAAPQDQGTMSDDADRPDAVSNMGSANRDGQAGDPRGPRLGPRGMMPPPPSKAAEFAIENGLFKFRVKCADDEPMQTCADIASRLLGQAMGTVQR